MLARLACLFIVITTVLVWSPPPAVARDTGPGAEIAPVMASWYGATYRGRRTASGERFDPAALTAAHPDLPLGTLVTVRRWSDGRAVTVRINDRGPYGGRGIDLSEAAARRLGLIADGTGLVTIHPVVR